MSPVNELLAKSLTLEELAARMLDHDEPAVRVFAERVIKAVDASDGITVDGELALLT